jgi:hypothetical protein
VDAILGLNGLIWVAPHVARGEDGAALAGDQVCASRRWGLGAGRKSGASCSTPPARWARGLREDPRRERARPRQWRRMRSPHPPTTGARRPAPTLARPPPLVSGAAAAPRPAGADRAHRRGHPITRGAAPAGLPGLRPRRLPGAPARQCQSRPLCCSGTRAWGAAAAPGACAMRGRHNHCPPINRACRPSGPRASWQPRRATGAPRPRCCSPPRPALAPPCPRRLLPPPSSPWTRALPLRTCLSPPSSVTWRSMRRRSATTRWLLRPPATEAAPAPPPPPRPRPPPRPPPPPSSSSSSSSSSSTVCEPFPLWPPCQLCPLVSRLGMGQPPLSPIAGIAGDWLPRRRGGQPSTCAKSSLRKHAVDGRPKFPGACCALGRRFGGQGRRSNRCVGCKAHGEWSGLDQHDRGRVRRRSKATNWQKQKKW